jgi:hypothetical protein
MYIKCYSLTELIELVIIHFWVIPQIHFFFKRKKSKNKIKASNVEKASQGGFQTCRKIKLQFWMEFEA